MVVNFYMAGVFLRHVHYSTPVSVNFEHQVEFGAYNTGWPKGGTCIPSSFRLPAQIAIEQEPKAMAYENE